MNDLEILLYRYFIAHAAALSIEFSGIAPSRDAEMHLPEGSSRPGRVDATGAGSL
jgi:hypothetical protein